MVGIGSGSPLDRTGRAQQAIAQASVVAGYTRYLDQISDLTDGKEIISSGMRKEVERCAAALKKAEEGAIVALVSSGDAGVYGMAGLALELAESEGIRAPIEIVPGVTAASTLAARLGAPLMLDFACISLSDLLTPWEAIKKRLEAVASADMVVALYNPRSSRRRYQLDEAAEIFRGYRDLSTPVGIGTALGTSEETVVLSDLGSFLDLEINMKSLVIIGNSDSKVIRRWMVNPRGYKI